MVTLRSRARLLFRELNDLMVGGRAGRFLMFGAVLLVTDAAFYKRCGCDKEPVEVVSATGPFTIAGRTYDFESGLGVSGVQLTLDGLDHDYSALTGEHGFFLLDDVEPGTYQVKTWLDGFDERSKLIVIDQSSEVFNIPLAPIHMTPILVQDTWVNREELIDNYDEMDYFRIGRKSGPGSESQSLLKLTAPSVTWGAHLMEARMTGYVISDRFDPDSPQALCNVIEDFDPTEVNWATRPSIGNLSFGTLIGIEEMGSYWKVEWDITDILERYRDPNPVEPTFGVNWTTDSPFGANIGSTECLGPSCGAPLTATVKWAAIPPDFPE